MHVSLMRCNPYMCACPVQCVSNTRLKSKLIGISFCPKDMGGTKGRTWMKGLDNGRPVQIDYQEACTNAFSIPLTTTIVRTLQRWWLGQSCVPSMEQRQWLQMWMHIVRCRECVCEWVIMLCVSIWSLCVCVINASGWAKLLWCKWTGNKEGRWQNILWISANLKIRGTLIVWCINNWYNYYCCYDYHCYYYKGEKNQKRQGPHQHHPIWSLQGG